MAAITIDQALSAAHEPLDGANRQFIARVMDNIDSITPPSGSFARLRHLPRAALVAMLLAALVVVSGTAYAAYQLWLKPHATIQQFGTNQYGREQALVGFQNCKDTASATYEVKSSANLTAEQVRQLLQARCEMDAITSWANSNQPPTPSTMTTLYPGAFTVSSIHGDTYNLHGTNEDITVNATKDTSFIVHGMQEGKDAIHTGDTVGYVEQDTYPTGGGWPTTRKPIAIVRLEMPANMYEPSLQNQVAKRQDCAGNPGESCVNNASIDVYPRNGESNAAPTVAGTHRQIQGRIVNHKDATVTIKASSGALYIITAPLDFIAKFNTQYSQNYQNTTIQNGDMLTVDYVQPDNANPKTILPDQLQSVSLMIEMVNKTDAIKKY